MGRQYRTPLYRPTGAPPSADLSLHEDRPGRDRHNGSPRQMLPAVGFCGIEGSRLILGRCG